MDGLLCLDETDLTAGQWGWCHWWRHRGYASTMKVGIWSSIKVACLFPVEPASSQEMRAITPEPLPVAGRIGAQWWLWSGECRIARKNVHVFPPFPIPVIN